MGYDLDEEVPTHSVLSKARSRYGVDIFQEIFDRIVGQCIKAGLVEGKQAFVDTTLIRANASKGSLVPRLRLLTPSEYTAEMLKEGERGGDKEKKKPSCNERLVSRTDPDATLQARKGKNSFLAYEGHYLIDGKRRVITGAGLTATTDSVYEETISMLRRDFFRHRLKFGSVCADGAYGTQSFYHFLFSEGITPNIPPQKPKDRKGYFRKDEFGYNLDGDYYECPAKRHLARQWYNKAKKLYVYRPSVRGTCRKCVLRSKCTSGKGDRQVKRLLYQDDWDKAREITLTPKYLKQIKRRKYMIEPIFGEAKEMHGLRRALYRGIKRVKIQVLWTATILNIKRLIKEQNKRLREAATLDEIIKSLSSIFRFGNLFGLRVLTCLSK